MSKYNLYGRSIEKDLMLYCLKAGVTIIAYSPLGQGRLIKELFIGRGKRIRVH